MKLFNDSKPFNPLQQTASHGIRAIGRSFAERRRPYVFVGRDACAMEETPRPHVPHSVALVVDLGCGTCRFSHALYEAFENRVLGVDPPRT